MRVSMAIMELNGVEVDYTRALDHELAPGVWPDMREHGAASDDWPALHERVQAADILVLGLADLARGEVVGLHAGRSSGCTATRACSTSTGSTRTTARSAAA